MSDTSLQVIDRPQMGIMRPSEALGVEEIMAQVTLIQSVMHKVMQEGQHYGTIPGCGDKKTLLQPGAQKLTMTFRLAPEYQIQETDLPRGHKEFRVICTLKSMASGTFVGQGVGCCSSMESKYRWRQGTRKCPKCGKETIIKGKAEYGGGWLCFAKKGGCGAKWNDGATEIEGQNIDRVENTDPADTFNTVLKIAKKRAFVDATITATAASDIFTQDVGDDETEGEETLAPPPSKLVQQSMPHLRPTTTPLAPAPVPQVSFKNASERKARFDAFLLKCKLKLVSDLEKIDAGAALEFMHKSKLLLPNETALSEVSELQLFRSVPVAPADHETDGDWWARVNEAVAKDGHFIKQSFEKFRAGDQLEGAEVQEDIEPVPEGASHLVIDVCSVTENASIGKNGKPYRLYIVRDENGFTYTTFDKKIATKAQALAGLKATIFFTETDKGNNLHKIIR